MTQRSFTQLVAAAQNGDGAACEELYRRTAQQMMGLALSMLKHEQDALDVLQDSYLYAFGKLDQLEKPESFAAWLYRLVANRCKNHLTRTRPGLFAASLTGEEGVEWELEDENSAGRPAESVDTAETRRLVMEMVDGLPEDQRACVLLHYFQEMKVTEIAALLAVPENTVKSRLGYARKKLRAQAEALERQGTKLHGAVLLPLLPRIAADSAARSLSAGGPALLEGILRGTGAAPATTAAAATTTVAAGGSAAASATATTTFLGTVAGKVAVGVVVAAVAIGGAAALLSRPEPEPGPASVVPEVPAVIETEPEPDPEPERVWQYVFDEQLPGRQGVVPLEEFHLHVRISAPAELYRYDPDTAEVWIGLQPGEEFQVVLDGAGGSGEDVIWEGDQSVLDRAEGGPLAPVYRAGGEGAGTLSLAWTGVENAAGCRIHVSVPGAPPEPEPPPGPEPAPIPGPAPLPEPAPATDAVAMTFLFQDESGDATDAIVAVGVRIGDYSVVLDDRVTGRSELYSEEERASGQAIITAAQAQELGLVWDFSYTATSLRFSTREDCTPAFYYQRDNGSSSISRRFQATGDHTAVIQRDGNSIKWG